MHRTAPAPAPALLGVLLVSACGGGSDDAASLPRLGLTHENANAATELLFDFTGIALDFAISSTELVDAVEAMSMVVPIADSMPCEDGGYMIVSHHDRDQSASLTSGDSIELEFHGCLEDDGTMNGTIAIELLHLQYEGDGRRLHAQVLIPALSMTFGADGMTVKATLPFEHWRTPSVERYRLYRASVSVEQQGKSEGIFDLTVDYEQRFPQREYWFSASGRVGDGFSGGSFEFSTPEPLRGLLGGYPLAGQLRLTGSGNSQVTLTAAGTVSSPRMHRSVSGRGITPISFETGWPPYLLDLSQPLRPQPTEPEPPPPPPPPLPENALVGRLIPLGAQGADILLDPHRSRVYVTVPQRNEIAVVSLPALQVTERILIGSQPRHMRLGMDGSTLYVTSHAAGSVEALDLDDGSVRRFEIGEAMEHWRTWDLVEFQPGQLLVSGNPIGEGGSAQVVHLDTASGASRPVAAHRRTFASTSLLHAAGSRFVYLAHSGSLAALDTLDEDIPVALEAAQGEFGATHGAVLNEDGGRIILAAGAVIQSESLTGERVLPAAGIPRFSTDFGELWVIREDGLVSVFQGSGFFEEIGFWEPLCGPDEAHDARHLGGTRWALLVGDHLCVVDTASPAQAPGAGDSPPPAAPPVIALAGIGLELGGAGFDLAVDHSRGLAYVSVPLLQEVVVTGVEHPAVLARIGFAGSPRGLHLSADGTTLYVGLAGSGAVAYVDTGTWSVAAVIDVAQALNHPDVYDVIETEPGRIFVTADPSSSGLSRLAQIRRDQSDAVSPGGSDHVFREHPRLAATADGKWLFVTQNFSPNRLYRLDLSAEDAPLVAISPHGAGLSGARMLEISADGERLYLGSGQVVSPTSLMPIGRIGAGVPRPAPGDEYIMVGSGTRSLERYDMRSEVLLERFETDCATAELTRIAPAAGGRWLLLGGDILCSIAVPAQP